MENIDILQTKIITLERLLEEKDNFILQQQVLINQLLTEKQSNNFPKQEGNCPAGGWHDYPTFWHSTAPPFCKKCGQSAPYSLPYYWSTTTDIITTQI